MATMPPALVDDAMREIFTRLPADDPRSLVRAAAVCRRWRAILSDPDFARGYRAFHGAAPMLGFLLNKHRTCSTSRAPHWGNHFVPTSTFRPPACQDRSWRVLDSRHGLVLFYTPTYCTHFVVRDLVTGDQWQIDADPRCYDIMWWDDDTPDEYYNGINCTATVLCAKDRCDDHLDCHGGPFLVALVGSEYEGRALAAIYSSETREWSDTVSIQFPDFYINRNGHSAVLRNKVYVTGLESDGVVEYDICEQQLSVITLPEDLDHPYRDLMGVEDGRLLFATVVKPRLYLWSMEAAGPSGAVVLAQRAVIELEPLVPPRVLLDIMSEVSAVGFAEGVGIIFVSTAAGLYTIELSSGRHNKVDERGVDKVMPYMSFCTGAWGQLPASDP